MKILDALKVLDPNNDTHWTQDGTPRIGILKGLSGDDTIRATDIPKGFTRASVKNAVSDKDDEELTEEDMEEAFARNMLLLPGRSQQGLIEMASGNAILLMEAATEAANADRFRRNNELQSLARGFQARQTAIRDLQDRIDKRETRRQVQRETRKRNKSKATR